jgi:two-component system, sensor histidine kinase and response regulator
MGGSNMNTYFSDEKNASILIVDDIPANLKVLGEILKGDGYKVRPVPNGMLALQVAEKEKPDLILLDIMMPDMDGYEVCRRLKANPKLSDIPIIFISALNETNDVVKALKSGGVDYVTKPFQSEEVLARVNTHVKLYRQSIELLNLNLQKDKFFSIIAHDLKGPLGGFMGMTELLAEEMPNMETVEIQEYLGHLRDASVNLFRLLENLLQWARLKQGAIPFHPENIRFQPIANECLSILQESAKNKNIEIVQDISDQLRVFADNNMLQTIVRNLVSNAIKFTPKNGTVRFSAKATDDNGLVISIQDTGIGMSPEMTSSLFNPGARNGRPGTDGEASTGLGLLLCKEFVEKHGGKIKVESEEEKGSVFIFNIPGEIN